MKKIFLSVSTLMVLSACSQESPTLVQQQINSVEENTSINLGVFQTGEKILNGGFYYAFL